jgi:predicted AAA+ superfamily ATPase
MKTLYELCVPRDSVFDKNQREDVWDITDLIENRIDPNRFFEENFLTDGMKVLFDTAFKRFHRQEQDRA